MAAGFDIKRLREKAGKTAAEVAKLIGVHAERLRKWEQRDVNPKDTADIEAVEAYFGRSLAELAQLDNFLFVQKSANSGQKNDSPVDYRDKYIALLEKQVASLNSQQVVLNSILAYNQTLFEAVVQKIAKDHKRKPAEVRAEMSKLLADKLERVGEKDTVPA